MPRTRKKVIRPTAPEPMRANAPSSTTDEYITIRRATPDPINSYNNEETLRLLNREATDFMRQMMGRAASQSEMPYSSSLDSIEPLLEDMFADEESDEDTQLEASTQEHREEIFLPLVLPEWDSRDDMDMAANKYVSQMGYRLRWIFYRQEREGVTRRQIPPFSKQDFFDKKRKSMGIHLLDSAESVFYDWNLGATDFIVRLELFTKNEQMLRCHFIYKPNMMELCYTDRLWDGEFFVEHGNSVWAMVKEQV